jgi:2-amino-4-hydroxy-6-hydroxymethyldihydropteridine diphosphokinase
MIDVALSLGSNLGDRELNLEQAVDLLAQEIFIEKISSKFFNKALLKPNSPKEWDLEFINIALIAKTDKNPFDLLNICQNVEKILGKNFNAEIWSPRIIDIDILLYGNFKIILPNLLIPHPEMHNREFVQKPLLEILPKGKFYD